MQEMDDYAEEHNIQAEGKKEDEENNGNYVESVESFGSKLGINQVGEADKHKKKEGPARRSDRNLDKRMPELKVLLKREL